MFLPLTDDTPRIRRPWVTLALIAACALVYVYQTMLGPEQGLRFARAAGAIPWEVSHLRDLISPSHPRNLVPPPFTIVTSLFLHGDVLHLLGNMWFLWVFGGKLEGYMRPGRFLLFYLLSGLTAAALQVVASPGSTMPMIGASGAIAGVLGAYAATFPRAQVRCLVFLLFFVTFLRLPASLLLGLWFLAQFLSAGGHTPGVAWFAHIGGFLTGLALARTFVRFPRRARVVYHLPPWQHDLERS